jgi:hypothetical protein
MCAGELMQGMPGRNVENGGGKYGGGMSTSCQRHPRTWSSSFSVFSLNLLIVKTSFLMLGKDHLDGSVIFERKQADCQIYPEIETQQLIRTEFLLYSS